MSTIEIVGLVAMVIVVLALVLGVSKLVLESIKAPLEARIAASYSPHEILMKDLAANSFGLESLGVWQLRGNGALVLTRDCLHYFRFVGGTELRVMLESIIDVSFTKTHLGKATYHNLLKVRFSEEGATDSVAWYVTDPQAWKSKLEALSAAKTVV
jgi:hypothetical protein